MGFNQYAYINEYHRNNYDRLSLLFPKGTKEALKAAAEENGVSISAYICRLFEASKTAVAVPKLQPFTEEQQKLLKKWQVPAKYFEMIESMSVETDERRKEAAQNGKRIACCMYTIYFKPGYINDITQSRIIQTDKTKEIRRIIVKTHAI